MRYMSGALFALVLLSVGATTQEKATLTTPQTVSVTDYEIMRVDLQRLPSWGLRLYYRDSAGKELLDEHTGAEAETLIKALNKANLSTTSLEKRALLHLQDAAAHGGVAKIGAGSITWTPQ
jgi:hypothetical protein